MQNTVFVLTYSANYCILYLYSVLRCIIPGGLFMELTGFYIVTTLLSTISLMLIAVSLCTLLLFIAQFLDKNDK